MTRFFVVLFICSECGKKGCERMVVEERNILFLSESIRYIARVILSLHECQLFILVQKT